MSTWFPLDAIPSGLSAVRSSKNVVHTEEACMQQALFLASRVKGKTIPNLAVGAVVVHKGRIVGQGATAPCGGPHAEVRALTQARGHARGSTLYVTLEPCCHFGRTPPCTTAIIQAGVVRVVVASLDPNPLVNAKGVRQLRKAGIKVETGLLGREARSLNEEYRYAVSHGSAWVTLKLACTWDGRIADTLGTSRWITSAASRRLVHRLRALHAAVAVGGKTLCIDDPRLDVRYGMCARPARMVFTSAARLSTSLRFFSGEPHQRTIVACLGNRTFTGTKGFHHHAEVWRGRGQSRHARLQDLLHLACKEGIPSILVEGGSRFGSFLLEHGLVNRLCLFYGGKILGGGLPALAFARPRTLSEALLPSSPVCRPVGKDWICTGLFKRNR